MVDVSTWSETPGSNTTVDGVSIAEACSPANLNNAIRSVMAGVKTFHVAYSSTVTGLSAYMPKAAGTFSGTQPIYTSEGAFLHHQSSSNASGKIYVLPDGDPDPSGTSAGDMVFFYTP